MKKLILLLIISVFALQLNAQIQYNWVNSQSGSTNQIGRSRVTACPTGGYFLYGSFDGTRSFGTVSLTADGVSDAFLAKYDMQGNCLWARRFGSSLSTTTGTALCVDGLGDIYVTGTFTNQLLVDTVYLMPHGNSIDMYLIKMDPAGTTIWSQVCGGFNTERSSALVADAQNNIYLAGNYKYKAYFGTDSIGNNITNQNIFIAKFNAAGFSQWVVDAGGNNDDGCNGISISMGKLYIGGEISGACVFGTHNITANGTATDAYVAQYDMANGSNLWVVKAGGTPSDFCYGLSTDNAGNIFITGGFYQSCNFGNGITLNGGTNSDNYIARYNSAGVCQWAKKSGSGANPDISRSIYTNPYGYSVITGTFMGTATFGTISINAAGGNDAFIAKYDPNGTCQYALHGGGAGTDGGSDVTWLPTSEFVVTGNYENSATFNTTTLTAPAGATFAIFNAMLPGTYTGINDITLQQANLVYPNPATDRFTIKANYLLDAKSVTLTDVTGKVCFETTRLNNDLIVNTKDFATGIYTLKINYSTTSAFQKVEIMNQF